MAITATQTPYRPFDMAYGANPITLDGITASQEKYALQITIVGQTTPIADIRQSPNRYARAIFDIQNILQSQIEPSKNNIDGLHYSASGFAQQNTRMRIANGELVQYQIAFTTETNGQLDAPFTISPIIYTTLGGAKDYWQVPFDEGANFIPIVDGTVDGCTDINFAARPLSDNQWTIADTETGDNLLTVNGGYPSPGGIDVQNVYAGDQCTKSFWQTISRVAGPYPASTLARGIEAFHILQCNAAGSIIQRYNVLPTPCNDYDHIQFAWMNSEGFRDQITFTKRNEKSVVTKKNNFLKEAADYNETRYVVDEQSRGFTTYSQTINENWTATSGFLNDEEAKLLESMFKSASVMVRFSVGEYANQWVPIQLLSSKYTEKTNRKDKLFQYTVNYRLANNIKSQRG